MLAGYLALICLVAVIAVHLNAIKKFPVPLVVGEIVGGIVLGATFLGILPPADAVAHTTLGQLFDLGSSF